MLRFEHTQRTLRFCAQKPTILSYFARTSRPRLRIISKNIPAERTIHIKCLCKIWRLPEMCEEMCAWNAPDCEHECSSVHEWTQHDCRISEFPHISTSSLRRALKLCTHILEIYSEALVLLLRWCNEMNVRYERFRSELWGGEHKSTVFVAYLRIEAWRGCGTSVWGILGYKVGNEGHRYISYHFILILCSDKPSKVLIYGHFEDHRRYSTVLWLMVFTISCKRHCILLT